MSKSVNFAAEEEEQHNTEWIEGLAILLAVVSHHFVFLLSTWEQHFLFIIRVFLTCYKVFHTYWEQIKVFSMSLCSIYQLSEKKVSLVSIWLVSSQYLLWLKRWKKDHPLCRLLWFWSQPSTTGAKRNSLEVFRSVSISPHIQLFLG